MGFAATVSLPSAMTEDDDDRLRLVPPLCTEIGCIMEDTSSIAILFRSIEKCRWPEELAKLETAGR